MVATWQEISNWFDEGAKEGFTHMMVVCDRFDYEDYPQYLNGTPEFAQRKVVEINRKPMTMVMEVYNLKRDKAFQLSLPHAFNF